MRVEIPYDRSRLGFDIDERRVIGVITPSEVASAPDPSSEIEKALRNPVSAPLIEGLSPRGKEVAIAVDDITRETPMQVLLPPILRGLEKAGARRKDIAIVVALGTHRRMTVQEMKEKYGAETVENYEIVNHAFDDEAELKYMGEISGEVPVWINKRYLAADIRIATGSIVPHFNAGWGGGGKILLPGLAGEETVGRMHVHSALTTPNGLGMENNHTRRLIDAFAEKVGIHLLVNTVTTRRREIAKVFCGHFEKSHRKGVEFSTTICGVEVQGLADITICSSHPADLEYWQGLKGLFSADLATKVGGAIVEVTPCPEGVSVAHPRWIDYLQYDTEELKEIYAKGGVEDLVALGLALNVAYVRERHPICIVSDGISDRDAGKMKFHKFDSINEALGHLSRSLGPDSKVNILTHGGETYPIVK